MTDKIGFVDTDNQDQQDPILGRIEDQSNEGWEFWQTLIIDFLLAFGALALVKEIVLFLSNLNKRGLTPLF